MKLIRITLALLILAAALAAPASALEYSIDAPDDYLFARPTSDDTIYEWEDPNVDRSKNAALIPPGFGTPTSYLPGSGEYLTPNLAPGGMAFGSISGSADAVTPPSPGSVSTGQESVQAAPGAAFTALTDRMYLSNGAIGKLSIPAIGVKDYYVWEGESTANMSKGLAHFSDTSVWDGNVGMAGHNRGAAYVIGAIKDMKVGDTITYTTALGTRTYEVRTVTTIPNNDWSFLGRTADNRITLITCLANHPEVRVCVQAVEV